jgi:hypothetical protein
MQQIETAIREHYDAPAALLSCNGLDEFFL